MINITSNVGVHFLNSLYQLNVNEAGATIRFGYGTYLYKPSIVSPNTRLSRVTKELKIGYTVENLDIVADEFYEWYHKIDYDEFVKGCDVYNGEYEQGFDKLYEQCDRYIKRNN